MMGFLNLNPFDFEPTYDLYFFVLLLLFIFILFLCRVEQEKTIITYSKYLACSLNSLFVAKKIPSPTNLVFMTLSFLSFPL